MAFLLDVNVLVALAWPSHIHHDLAHAWFARHQRTGWATCPATQAGFVRVTSNPAFSPDALTPQEAFGHLRKMVELPRHAFWADDRSLVASRFLAPGKLVGYRQMTDAHLLAVALRHGGVLATLDRGSRAVIPSGQLPGVVQVLTEETDPRPQGTP